MESFLHNYCGSNGTLPADYSNVSISDLVRSLPKCFVPIYLSLIPFLVFLGIFYFTIQSSRKFKEKCYTVKRRTKYSRLFIARFVLLTCLAVSYVIEFTNLSEKTTNSGRFAPIFSLVTEQGFEIAIIAADIF